MVFLWFSYGFPMDHLEQCQVDHITPRVVGIGDEHCSWGKHEATQRRHLGNLRGWILCMCYPTNGQTYTTKTNPHTLWVFASFDISEHNELSQQQNVKPNKTYFVTTTWFNPSTALQWPAKHAINCIWQPFDTPWKGLRHGTHTLTVKLKPNRSINKTNSCLASRTGVLSQAEHWK